MGFVGFNSSFCTVLCADLAAGTGAVRYADGRDWPISTSGTRDARQHRDDAAFQARRAAGRRCLSASHASRRRNHFKHFDELVQADIGVARFPPKSTGGEIHTAGMPTPYGRFLASGAGLSRSHCVAEAPGSRAGGRVRRRCPARSVPRGPGLIPRTCAKLLCAIK